MDRLMESISSSNESFTTVEDCVTKAVAAGTGAFCVGFSAGAATQVHFHRYLPRSVRALLVIPIGLGSLAATTMYRHGIRECQLGYSANNVSPIVNSITLHPSLQNIDADIKEV